MAGAAADHVIAIRQPTGICLTALFFLARDQNGDFKTLPEAILAIILLVIVVRPSAMLIVQAAIF
jgi:hypothetical protein